MKHILLIVLLMAASAFAQNDPTIGTITTSGSDCSTATSCVSLALPKNAGTASLTLTGTFTGTVQFEVSANYGASYVSATGSTPAQSSATSATAVGTWVFPASGLTNIRARASALSSGTVNVTLQSSPAANGSAVSLAANQSVNVNQVGGANTAASAALADATANPTVGSFGAFAHVWNATTWDRLREGALIGSLQPSVSANALGDATSNSSQIPAKADLTNIYTPTFNFGFNGTTWDRLRTTGGDSGGKTGQIEVAQAQTGCYVVSTSATACKATAGILHRITINTPVASATLKLFDLATASCTGTPSTNPKGVITIPSTITSESPFTLEYNITFANGICVLASSASLDTMVVFQ